MTALLDTGSQVTHVSHDFCLANGIEIHPLAKLVNIEGTGVDSIEYLGYAEANLSLPMGSQNFDIEALLLVLPTTVYLADYHVTTMSVMVVPVSIGTTITDMVVDFINQNKPDNVKVLEGSELCHTFKEVGASTTQVKEVHQTYQANHISTLQHHIVKGNTKFRSHGMKLNLIAESSSGTQLPSGVQCSPTYCTLEPGSSRVSIGLRNLSSRSITIPS